MTWGRTESNISTLLFVSFLREWPLQWSWYAGSSFELYDRL
jgi:hypothetical protein